jgi:hypothetical protein
VPVASNAGFVSDRLSQRLPEADSDIFNRMMLINMQIAFGYNFKIKLAVVRQYLEHVIEKANSCGNVCGATPVERNGDSDVGF